MITNIQLQNAKPRETDYTLNVDSGLSLLIKANGSKLWRCRYTHAGKRYTTSFGKYPQVSMKQARNKLRDFHELLDQGINPEDSPQLSDNNQSVVRFLWQK